MAEIESRNVEIYASSTCGEDGIGHYGVIIRHDPFNEKEIHGTIKRADTRSTAYEAARSAVTLFDRYKSKNKDTSKINMILYTDSVILIEDIRLGDKMLIPPKERQFFVRLMKMIEDSKMVVKFGYENVINFEDIRVQNIAKIAKENRITYTARYFFAHDNKEQIKNLDISGNTLVLNDKKIMNEINRNTVRRILQITKIIPLRYWRESSKGGHNDPGSFYNANANDYGFIFKTIEDKAEFLMHWMAVKK